LFSRLRERSIASPQTLRAFGFDTSFPAKPVGPP
jgi:hypothetical protein